MNESDKNDRKWKLYNINSMVRLFETNEMSNHSAIDICKRKAAVRGLDAKKRTRF